MKNEILQCYLETYQLSEDTFVMEDNVPVFHSDFRKECFTQFGMGWVCGRDALLRLEKELKCSD